MLPFLHIFWQCRTGGMTLFRALMSMMSIDIEVSDDFFQPHLNYFYTGTSFLLKKKSSETQ